ncbi:MAG: response regulator transcription factor [Nevskia sp.]|nr:response regulator transcription factor [Nevskia sp.]
MRVVLADPHTLFRAGLRHLIEAVDGAEVIGESDTGKGLLEQVVKSRPDLVFCEVVLPDVSGFEVAQQIRRHYPKVAVMFLTASTDSANVRNALKAGAVGFLAKSSEAVEIELALRAVGKGQVYLSPSVSLRALEPRRSTRPESSAVLSRRQREVLRLIGRGKSTKEIAALMGVSPKTVETHRARLMQALGLHGTNALTHYAVRVGLHLTD